MSHTMQIPTASLPNPPQEPPPQHYISQSQFPFLTAHPTLAPPSPSTPLPTLRRCSSAPASVPDSAHRIMPSPVDVDTAGSGTVYHAKPRTVMRRRSQSFHEPRDFPPAMPLLAWTGNGNVQMPWVLKRSYTDNGHLVIHEVKVRSHDFFRVSRADGRLTLHRMHMDEPVEMEALELKEKEEKRVRRSLLRPAPLPKREKHRLLLAPPLPQLLETTGREDQEMIKKKKKKKGKESFEELKRMEQGLFRLRVSASASALSSLATSSLATATTEKTDAVASLLRRGNCKRLSDASRASSLPSIKSAMPELLFGANGGKGGGGAAAAPGGGWLTDNRSDSSSPLQLQIPAIGPVRS